MGISNEVSESVSTKGIAKIDIPTANLASQTSGKGGIKNLGVDFGQKAIRINRRQCSGLVRKSVKTCSLPGS